MKELSLRGVDVVKLALLMAVFYLIISFIVFLLIFLVGSAFIPSLGKEALPFAGLGIFLVIVGPIIYAVFAFIVFLIVGLFLNLSLSITGGLPLKFKE